MIREKSTGNCVGLYYHNYFCGYFLFLNELLMRTKACLAMGLMKWSGCVCFFVCSFVVVVIVC